MAETQTPGSTKGTSQAATYADVNGTPGQAKATEAVRKTTKTTQAKRRTQGRPAKREPESFAAQAAGVAESVVLVPVGATLEARDAIVDRIQPWTSRGTAEKELDRVRRDVRRYASATTASRGSCESAAIRRRAPSSATARRPNGSSARTVARSRRPCGRR
jgi:hypothetical protein